MFQVQPHWQWETNHCSQWHYSSQWPYVLWVWSWDSSERGWHQCWSGICLRWVQTIHRLSWFATASQTSHVWFPWWSWLVSPSLAPSRRSPHPHCAYPHLARKSAKGWNFWKSNTKSLGILDSTSSKFPGWNLKSRRWKSRGQIRQQSEVTNVFVSFIELHSISLLN